MDKPTTPSSPPSRPRFVKSTEILDEQVEVLYIDEIIDGAFGPELLFDLQRRSGEVITYSRHHDAWRERGVALMREMLERGEPVKATLVRPGKAYLWKPFDLRGPRVSAGRAARLQQLGFDVAADDDGKPQLRGDDVPMYTDQDAPADDDPAA